MQHHESHLSLVPTGVYPGSGSGNTMQLIPGVNPLMSGELAPHLGKLHVSQISVMVMVRYSLREEFDSLVLGSLPARVNDLPFRPTNRLERCEENMPLICHVSCSHHSLSTVEKECIVSIRSAMKSVSFAACFMRSNFPDWLSGMPPRGRLRSIIRYSSIGRMTPIGYPQRLW